MLNLFSNFCSCRSICTIAVCHDAFGDEQSLSRHAARSHARDNPQRGEPLQCPHCVQTLVRNCMYQTWSGLQCVRSRSNSSACITLSSKLHYSRLILRTCVVTSPSATPGLQPVNRTKYLVVTPPVVRWVSRGQALETSDRSRLRCLFVLCVQLGLPFAGRET